MAGPENVAFHELCRSANQHLTEALDYLWATPAPNAPAPTPREMEALYEARQSVAAAKVALRSIRPERS
ncbi:MAG: hypothetical protein JWO67_4030 [Streptosporangiaceae bacterium]|nr:hypothetical protein [Streptosporangiaceae bacterium]